MVKSPAEVVIFDAAAPSIEKPPTDALISTASEAASILWIITAFV